MMNDPYTPREETLLRNALSTGSALSCPRCASPLRATPVLPPAEVSYVRNRVLLECDSCGRRTVLDKN
jgi:hypothetical protein